jgi:hypothetical protein
VFDSSLSSLYNTKTFEKNIWKKHLEKTFTKIKEGLKGVREASLL